jgi:thiol:disulfide interchange protein
LLRFANEHSYVLAAGFALLALAIFLIARHVPNGAFIWIGAAIIAVIIWFAMRTGTGSQYASVDQYEAAIASGQPTLVEFYSDY